MFDHDTIFRVLGMIVVCAPLLLTIVLGVMTLASAPLSERTTSLLVQISTAVGLCASLCILVLMLIWGPRFVPIDVGDWVDVRDYQFSVKFVFDRLSVPFAVLTFVLCGVIGAFASRYMHREPGYNRFFVMYSLFVLGMVITSLAGTIETLFTGWELVGLSSALLVAFFHERAAPVRNGLRVWTVYRISDAALLIASVVMHHLHGHGDFEKLLGTGTLATAWPGGHVDIPTQSLLLVGFLLILAAAGKSALVPFSGWLPRAMEGPTPSSAVFYGALSVHLGAFLLLRISPILAASLLLSSAVIALGLITAMFASFAGRVQTDIKSALSFASLTQVGIIVMEIGLAYFWPPMQYVALVHILGHACFRTLQFLRAPTLLYDYGTMENALGNRLPRLTGPGAGWLPESTRTWLYRLALEKGYLDSWMMRWLVEPFLKLLRGCDALERRWADLFDGGGPELNGIGAAAHPTHTSALTGSPEESL
ncbi:NADH-quinone oxidoreductase subunit L [Anatilimnocola aggregata]|uniref:NADH-quinone oxidoreductase subunit L n=1 Tax=Anatilimnocola aggregata TaxID=2528021 RepID=A0A517Y570_9BACT|nr:proton-conducting transporter membrane subunit [Anatilimnocola aggregata]QDU25272.1 NADH-quinone oxidoreductase subunit L [Anatilimnocola aggregata]